MTFIEHMHYFQLIFQKIKKKYINLLNMIIKFTKIIFTSMIIHNHSFLQIKLQVFKFLMNFDDNFDKHETIA